MKFLTCRALRSMRKHINPSAKNWGPKFTGIIGGGGGGTTGGGGGGGGPPIWWWLTTKLPSFKAWELK